MSDLNSVTLSGNLTRDPELRQTASGKSVVSLRIAFKTYPEKSNFIDVTAWEGLGELLAKVYSKGDPICLTGGLSTREYEKDGQKRTIVEVVARDVKLPPKPKDDDLEF